MIEPNLVNQIYNLLKEKIIGCELKMGQRIDINAIARDFGVSQTPVREVVNRLIKDGLVDVVPRKGYFVVSLNVRDLEEIYDLRRLIETHALEPAIESIETERLRELLEYTRSLRDGVENRDTAKKGHYLKDIELHTLIVNSSPNRRLREIYSQLFDIIKMILKIATYESEHEASLEEHVELIEAMLERDVGKAKKVLNKHIDNALKRLRRVFREKIKTSSEGMDDT